MEPAPSREDPCPGALGWRGDPAATCCGCLPGPRRGGATREEPAPPCSLPARSACGEPRGGL
eukprot:8654464-Alexandrium_andersonii.AAC.1